MTEIRCDIPNSDGVRILRSETELAVYLKGLGSPLFDREGDVVTIPSFAAGRAEFSKAKQIDCDRWGCE